MLIIKRIIVAFFFAVLCAQSIFSQQDVVKTWEGKLSIQGNTLRILIHITQTEDEKLAGALDSPDQGAKGIPVTSVTLEKNKIKMEIPSISAVYEGEVNDSSNLITGNFHQMGMMLPLTLKPADGTQIEEAKNYIGYWQGKLNAMGNELTIVAKFYKMNNDSIGAYLDSPDQGAFDLPATKVIYNDDSVYFEVPVVAGYYTGRFTSDKTKIEGTWYQGMALPLTLEKTDKAVNPNRPQEPKKPYPFNEEEITFENKEAGITLAGTFTYPREGSNFPVVVLVSGSGPQDRDEALLGHKPFLVWADYLTRNGIAVLRYDDRGIGKSTGNFNTAISTDFAGDAIGAVKYLSGRKEIDKTKIGIVGHSEGGLIAPIAANKSDEVSFIVLVAGPAVPGDEIILLQSELILRKTGKPEDVIKKSITYTRKIFDAINSADNDTTAEQAINKIGEEYLSTLSEEEKNQPENSKEVLEMMKNQFLSPWFKFFLKFDPRGELTKLQIPTLAIFGENDLQVPPSQNKEEMEKALAESKTKYKVVELPKLNHLFQESETGAPAEYAKIEETASPKMLELMTNWIKEVTK